MTLQELIAWHEERARQVRFAPGARHVMNNTHHKDGKWLHRAGDGDRAQQELDEIEFHEAAAKLLRGQEAQ